MGNISLDAIAARARNEALAEAAALCESYTEWAPQWGEYRNQAVADKAAMDCAEKIRALIAKEP